MSKAPLFTIESFYKFIGQRKLMGAKCNNCGSLLLPPRPVCSGCLATSLEWVELKGEGKLLTYTIIHIATKQFEPLTPYAVGIVKLRDGPSLLGMIRGVDPKNIKIGMDLAVDFDTATPAQWPTWPRYFFRPL